MGATFTKEDELQFVAVLFSQAETNDVLPDIGIDTSLRKYSELNSAAVLQDYSNGLLGDLRNNAPDYVKTLGTTIARLQGVPGAVGLGALVISLILDLAIKSFIAGKTDNTLNMVRRVFAEEKASGVRDSMDECLKRLSMFMGEPSKILDEINSREKRLSEQLTTLRNSMIDDNQMSSRAMRFWTNGAAFHAQMLIHAARLKMIENSWNNVDVLEAPITRAVDHYLKDLDELLKKYKTYKKSTISINTRTRCAGAYMTMHCDEKCAVYENELGKSSLSEYDIFPKLSYAVSRCRSSRDAFIDYMFEEWSVIKELKAYFTRIKSNIRKLILQSKSFSL